LWRGFSGRCRGFYRSRLPDRGRRFGELIVVTKLLTSTLQIMDNAPIHVANDIFGIVVALLQAHGIRLIRLPKYTPEWNPVELIWAQASAASSLLLCSLNRLPCFQVKRCLREDRDYVQHSFLYEIIQGFQSVKLANVVSYYDKCLQF
jgi:transposase